MADVEQLLRHYGNELDVRCPPVTSARLEQYLRIEEPDVGWFDPDKHRRRVAVLGVAAAVVVLVVLILSQGDTTRQGQTFTPSPILDPPVEGGPPDPEQLGGESTPLTVVLSSEGVAIPSTTEIVETSVTGSSIGAVQWTPISLDASLISSGRVVLSPEGFAAVGADGQLLMSDDAVEWRAVASPFPGRISALRGPVPDASFPQHGMFQLSTLASDGTAEHWVSSDFVTWRLQDGGSPTIAAVEDWISGPDFLEIESGRQAGYNIDAEMPGGARLTNITASIDWRLLTERHGGLGFRQRLEDGALYAGTSWDAATAAVDILLFASVEEQGLNQDLWPNGPAPQPSGVQFRLSASGTVDDWVIDVSNVATAELIGTIKGALPPLGPEDPVSAATTATLDDTMRLLAGHRGLGAFFLSADNELELVDHPPWVSSPGSWPTFVLEPDAAYAYYDSGNWRSTDGRSWQSLERGTFPTVHAIIEGPDGALVAEADHTLNLEGRGPVPWLLRSSDGIDWTVAAEPPTFDDDQFWFRRVIATDHGFVLLAFETELVIWTSVDGDIWEQGEVGFRFDEIRSQADPFNVEISSGRNAVLITASRDGVPAPSTLWKIEIDQ